jgi:hypothetical protein
MHSRLYATRSAMPAHSMLILHGPVMHPTELGFLYLVCLASTLIGALRKLVCSDTK